MKLKLLQLLPLDKKDLKLLIKVFKISLFCCITIVLSVWIIQKVRLSKLSSLGISSVGKRQYKKFNLSIPNIELGSGSLSAIDIEAHKLAARHYENLDQPRKAINHLLRIISSEKHNRSVLLDLGTCYLKAGQYQKSLEILSGLANDLETDSITESAMIRYGLALFHNGEIKKSLEQLDLCIRKYPLSPEAACYLGQVEAEINPSSTKAESLFTKSVELEKNYSEGWYQLARFYMNRPGADRDDYITARASLLRQIEIEPLNPKAHSRLGMVYYYLNEPDMAKKSYQIALALNPDDYNTHYNLGEYYFTVLDDRVNALKEFKKTVELNPDHVQANFKIGLICLQNDDFNMAARSFENARKNDPQNIRVLLQLAVTYERKGMIKEAEAVYHDILKIDALNQIAKEKLKLLTGAS